MADKKEAKGKEAEAKAEKGKAGAAKADKKEQADTPTKAGRRSKLIIIGGIAAVALLALGVGGFFTYKTFAAKAPLEAAAPATAHGTPAADAKPEHGAAPKDTKTPAAGEHAAAAPAADAHGAAPAAAAEHGAAPAGEPEKKEASKKKTSEFGKIFAVPKMDVNIGGADLGRGYVRISVALEFTGEDDQQKELEGRLPQIRDIIISTVSSRHKNDLLARNGKEVLRKDLLNSINRVAERPVRNVYFTDFLVE